MVGCVFRGDYKYVMTIFQLIARHHIGEMCALVLCFASGGGGVGSLYFRYQHKLS